MPLVVPILRLAMLFLNIYDSYKVLKPPSPSSRHANRPSLRAVTQRKRNIKGCLAVWLVWCCYLLYERIFDPIVSLFIPFYDELKSLVIIFLILTRARGAEPVYLHIIRPFLKPYTETLDSVLDFMSVISDIALAIVSVPVNTVIGAWRRRFGRGDVPSDDGQMDRLHSDTGEQPNGHPLVDISREAPDTHSRIPRATIIRKADSGSSLRSLPMENEYPIVAPSRDETEKHEVWYPPPSAYEEDDEDNRATPKPDETATSSSTDSETTLVTVEEVDEWRLYPQFPSAYPPTPLITLTRLVSKSADLDANPRINGSALPKIDEMSNEGFRLSLSPPLDATNPGSFGDLGDEKHDLGIHEPREDDDMTMADDRDISMADSTSLDEDDEEDEFNITLQTPVPVRVISETLFHASRMTSRTTSLATTMSTRSLSAGLSTVDNGSSLRTRSSLDSISSAAVSSGEDSPVIGKKRPLPAPRRINNRNDKVFVNSGLDPALTNDSIGDERHASIMRSSDMQKIHDDGTTATDKRRRVTSPNRIGVRTSKPIRHVRPRLARGASPPARIQRFERKTGPGQAKLIPQTRTSALRTDRWAHGGANSGAAISKSGPRRVLASQVEATTLTEDS